MPMVSPGVDLIALGQFLKQRRERLGFHKTDAAKAAGVSARTVRRIETGDYQATRPTYFRLAEAYGISVAEIEDLIGGTAA